MASSKALESQNEYTAGWIVALPLERAAATAMLDEQHTRPSNFEQPSTDTNSYTLGRIGDHNVVIASLAAGVYGTTNATTTALGMLSSFPQIRFGLLVGIGAGVPNDWQDIRLGDVVVSQPNGNNGGVVQYDLGRAISGGRWERRDFLARPPEVLLKALGNLESEHELESSRITFFLQEAGDRRAKFKTAYAHPGVENDRFFEPTYLHVETKDGHCEVCDPEREVKRSKRTSTTPEIHYGIIGSGNTLVKDATTRENIIADMGLEIICLEMEAAGLMNDFPCLVVRGISDYADSHKNFAWQRYASGAASAYAKELLAYIPATEISTTTKATKVLDGLHSIVNHLNTVEEREVRQRREREVNELLQSLHSCPYAERKDRNTERVKGTCEWFTNHPQFCQWNNSDYASVLWVSADPGCGKSTLAKYLINELLPQPGNRTVSYFFFKDDFDDQRSAAIAICSILRQLFINKPHLLEEWILNKFKQGGTRLLGSFWELWDILVCVSARPEAGVIICVLDALDECCDNDKFQILDALSGPTFSGNGESKLKFLVTSRPYDDIRRGFAKFRERVPFIHLSGEDEVEVEKISEEIQLVVQHRTQELSKEKSLRPDECLFLQEQLLAIPHRTYLWVYLTLGVIEETPGFSRGNVRKTISVLPRTVHDAYEKILARSADEVRAKKLLQIVTAAMRPLSIHEMSVALTIEESHKTYKDLQEDLEPEARFQNTVRELCGLFVSVINGRIYLLHQTAKEFLVPSASNSRWPRNSKTRPQKWKHSLPLPDSSRTIAEICIWYLNLNDLRKLVSIHFDAKPIPGRKFWERPDPEEGTDSLVLYAAKNWATHFREAGVLGEEEMTISAIRLCDTKSKEYKIWSRLSHGEVFRSWNRVKPLHVASFYGLDAVVEQLIETKVTANERDFYPARFIPQRKQARLNVRDRMRKTPLSWAAKADRSSVVTLLIDKGANVNVKDTGGHTALSLAASHHFLSMATLLLERGAKVNVKNKTYGCTPLLRAVSSGNDSMVELLLKGGANVNVRDWSRRTPLSLAAEGGHASTTWLLLRWGAEIDARDEAGRTPLLLAANEGNEAVVRVLLERRREMRIDNESEREPMSWLAHLWKETTNRRSPLNGVDVNARDNWWRTPLLCAAGRGCESMIMLLLDNGARLNVRDTKGHTPLSMAIGGNHLLVFRLLVERGVEIETRDEEKRTPLCLAAGIIDGLDIVRLLLDKGADIHARDRRGRTPLSWAAGGGPQSVIQALLERGAEIETRDDEGRTPLSWAAGSTFQHSNTMLDKVQLLLDKGADVNARDGFGLTPLSRTDATNNERTIRLLKDRGATT
ncbi:hypothetical protein MMC10_004162 [Thelotrema lepadinum]|nr:hypothetical protein [Thelotrema lepadinum]